MERVERKLLENWEITGDNPPGGPDLLFEPARSFLKDRAESMGLSRGLPEGHELATRVGDEIVPFDKLSLKAKGSDRSYEASFFSEHKTEITLATLTIAALIIVARELRVRHGANK